MDETRSGRLPRRPKARRGFTLMEMLIVVAIIAVLVAIAIPVFMGQMERARVAADMANARSAYAVASAQALSEPTEGTAVSYYDPASSQLKGSAAGIAGYGQSGEAADYEVGGVRVNGKAEGAVLRITTQDGVVKTIAWGTGGLGTWSTLSGNAVEDNTWWNHSAQREAAFNAMKAIDNNTRKKSDVEILSAIADYFDGLSWEEASKIMGTTRMEHITASGKKSALFEYAIDNGGSIRINNLDTNYQPYFSAIGYDARNYVSGKSNSEGQYEKGMNYTDKFLFTSDEMIGSTYGGSEYKNTVYITFQQDGDGVKDTKVWVEGRDKAGFTSE